VAVAEGSNEIPAIPALLQLLMLKGCIVTIDAVGCQTATVRTIQVQGADYVLALKANQETLHQAVVAAFAEGNARAGLPYRQDTHREVDKGHGRLEVRTTTVIDDPDLLTWLNPDHAWDGLTGVARLEAERRIGGASSRETRYYLTSLTAARPVHHAIRSHWSIEMGSSQMANSASCGRVESLGAAARACWCGICFPGRG
jgi:predicted transposase YbfD/YdcC